VFIRARRNGRTVLIREPYNIVEFDTSEETQVMLEPKSGELQLLLGRAYQAKRDLTRAEAAYLKAVELNPNLVAAYVSLGQLYGVSKEYDRSISQLEKAIARRAINHQGNPVLAWMASNLVVTQDPAGNKKPDKAKSTERIDGMVALVMALYRAILDVDPDSVYESRGVLEL